MNPKERILDASMKLFQKYGIRAITMDRIASELGISKRTIYEHFKDKDELLSQSMVNFVKNNKKEIECMIRESDNVINFMFLFFIHQSEIMRNTNPQFAHDLKKYHQKVFSSFSDKNEFRDYSLTRSFLEKGIEQGLFRKEINVELVNYFLHFLIDLFGHEANSNIRNFGHKEIFENIFLSCIRGISTLKGIKQLEKNLENRKTENGHSI